MAVFWRTFGFFHCANFLFILIPHLLLHIVLWVPARSRRHRLDFQPTQGFVVYPNIVNKAGEVKHNGRAYRDLVASDVPP